jgi:predicted CoA-substrate-specific enzyme activase
MAPVIGIDVGSVAVKAVLLDDGQPLQWHTEATAPDVAAQCQALVQQVAEQGGCDSLPPACATGYGRNLVGNADDTISEIVANAAGAGWVWRNWDKLKRWFVEAPRPAGRPEKFGTIVDVGGQDSKVITFAEGGLVEEFAMNDRCAAGTGRFLEVMARVLEVDLQRLDKLAQEATRPCAISSACTVFAESEVISLLTEGADTRNVAAGIFDSIADRVATLARQVGFSPPVLFDGGPSRSRALTAALAEHLGTQPAVAPCGQLVTAIGAGLLAERNPAPSRGSAPAVNP